MERFSIMNVLLISLLSVSCVGGDQQVGGALAQADETSRTAAPVSSAAPDFTLDDIDGDEFRLHDHLDGSVVLLYFWATCCEPCRVEMPHLERLHQTYRARGFRIIAICMDGPETIARVRSYISRYGFTFTVLLDEETEVMQMYNPRRASPFSVLIDREGAVVWSREGYSPGDEAALEEQVQAAIGLQD